ncbi:hypothetical protein [Caballeronia cordobensis]|uniref:hypothetical protein n=1 Tax=Caballeronia cordobensis TaxID=1353886 RepID=UPI000A3F953E|nr:hypothetical protein [Caballeronia cordobensis]
MAQAFPPDREDNGESNEFRRFERWPAKAPTAAIARAVLQVDEAITLLRRATLARLTAQGDAVPFLSIKPSRLELAVIIALAETYGTALYRDARFLPVIDFIAEYGAVKLVQRVMYGTRPTTHFDVTPYAVENARLAELLRDARPAFEFLCATWPEAFMGQASEALAQLGLPRLRSLAPPAAREPPLKSEDGERDDG